MSSDINLLIKKDIKLLKQQKRVLAFRVLAIGLLVVMLIFSIATFLLNKRFSSPSISQEDPESFLNQMAVLKKKEAKLNLINNRINNISNFLDKRTDTYKILNTLLGKVPEGILLDSLELTQSTADIKASSYSLSSMDSLISNLIDMATRKEIINRVKLNSLDADSKEGKYAISISLGY